MRRCGPSTGCPRDTFRDLLQTGRRPSGIEQLFNASLRFKGDSGECAIVVRQYVSGMNVNVIYVALKFLKATVLKQNSI